MCHNSIVDSCSRYETAPDLEVSIKRCIRFVNYATTSIVYSNNNRASIADHKANDLPWQLVVYAHTVPSAFWYAFKLAQVNFLDPW